APAQDQFYAAEHGRRRPCLGDGAAVDLGLDAKVTLNPGDRIDNDMRHYLVSPSPCPLAPRWLTAWPTPCTTAAAATSPVSVRPTGSTHRPTLKPTTS